jgi:hypothetical protein
VSAGLQAQEAQTGAVPAPPPERTAESHLLAGLKLTCERMLDTTVAEIRAPGDGRRARSYRMRLTNGQSVIVTRRNSARQARLEERVLFHLSRHGAPVPRVLGFNGLVMIQEDVGSARLSTALHLAEVKSREFLLDNALISLAALHHVASAAGLDRTVPIRGADEDWVIGLLDQPAVLGGHLSLPAPRPDLPQLLGLLLPLNPRFVKWNARPSEAAVSTDGHVAWFDFEYSGARNRLDDLAWLLSDETMPDLGDVEDALLEKHLPAFADGREIDNARLYLFAFGTFHMAVRLAMILARKPKNAWQNTGNGATLEQKTVGSGLELAQRLCTRAAKWSSRCEPTKPLSDWFAEVGEKLPSL